MYMLGIDIGSSFLKSSILNLDKLCIEDTCSVPTPGFLELPPERKEIPIREVAESVRELIEKAQQKYALEGVIFSVQMHGFMLYNSKGEAISNYISWQDIRGMVADESGESLFEQLRREVPSEYFRKNGICLKPNHSLLPLHHYIKECPPKEKLELAMMGDGLTRMLTGQKVSMHPTVAASSGLYDLQTQSWNMELIERLGLQMVEFPNVCESSDAQAVYHSAYGDVPIYLALGDHQAAVLGTYVEEGDIVINIGTGGQISFVGSKLEFGAYETRPFFEGRFLRAMTQLPSGRSLNVLMRFIMSVGKDVFGCMNVTEAEIWRFVDTLSGEEVPSDHLAVDFSFFEHAGGSIRGISGDNFTVKNLLVDTYRSMAKEYLEASKDLLSDGCDPKSIICTGGVVRKNPLLLHCIQEQFGLPCRLAPYSDDTMVGLLRYAQWCKKKQSLFVV